MPTMPAPSPTGQPDRLHAWFRSGPGRGLLDSERALVAEALDAKPGRPWLWLGPCTDSQRPAGRGLALSETAHGWAGPVTCALPLPLPSEAFCTVVLQHPAAAVAQLERLLEEAARILEPGGRLWLFALNPLAPYRWHWRGLGVRAPEPLTWRRRLRLAGLRPEPVSRGIGPCWRVEPSSEPQDGPGLRAAYLVRAEKRSLPLTPVRGRRAIRLAHGATPG
jgi:SAM-dependent methyltransferase